ncbi:MAG: hypothetical protein H6849_03295 [Alphaproteobacteria bacterium]|nr:MAG: hypothetical protein H6849_03295 [Alphaproteobacteria bacterium]
MIIPVFLTHFFYGIISIFCLIPSLYAAENVSAAGPEKLYTTPDTKESDQPAEESVSTETVSVRSPIKQLEEETEKKDHSAPSASQEFKPLWLRSGSYFQGKKQRDEVPSVMEIHDNTLSSWVQWMQKAIYVTYKEQTVVTRTKSGESKTTMGLGFFRSQNGTCYVTPVEPQALKLGTYYMVVPSVEEVLDKTKGQKTIRRQRQSFTKHPWVSDLKCANDNSMLVAIGAFDLQSQHMQEPDDDTKKRVEESDKKRDILCQDKKSKTSSLSEKKPESPSA